MRLLVLGGTAWLGRAVSTEALSRGHKVTCLARGESGPVADGACLNAADRRATGGYDSVDAQDWDAVVELSWQPGLVRGAVDALRDRSRHWIYVSSASVYAEHGVRGQDESAALLSATDCDVAGTELYGEAKVACELITLMAGTADLLIARSGLIGGPGDPSDRAGYWVARAARDLLSPMLVPDTLTASTQVVDVRDLARWLVACAEQRITGTFDAVGPETPLEKWIATSRTVGRHTGPVVRAPEAWLLEQAVAEFMGPESLPLWLADPDWQGFGARSGEAARARGLTHRPAAETIADTLKWERELGLDRPRVSGISAGREAELLACLSTQS